MKYKNKMIIIINKIRNSKLKINLKEKSKVDIKFSIQIFKKILGY
jgi:hypothetical protein